MKRFIILFMFLLIFSMFTIVGCSATNNKSTEDSGKIKVYTTLYVLEEFSNKIGGDNVITTNIVPAGASPHHFEPTAKDVMALTKADIFLYNGAGMEGWLKKVLGNLTDKDVELVNASKSIKLRADEDGHGHDSDVSQHDDENEGNVDAHVWLNPLYALQQAEKIRDAFIKIDPSHQSYYENNFQELKNDLLELDTKYYTVLAASDRKDFFVSHAAFGYLAEKYGLVQHSISGYIPSDEPSPSEMTKLITAAKNLKVQYILVDPMDVTKISGVLADEIGAEILFIRTLANITDEEKNMGLGYFKGMEENLESLRKALNDER